MTARRSRLAAVPKDDPGPQLPIRTVEVRLTGDLAGFHLTMRMMTAAAIIATQRGTFSETDALEMVANRTVSHNLPVKDLLDLDYWICLRILSGWSEAMRETALPLATESS